MMLFEIKHYVTDDGCDIYDRWYRDLMAKKPQIAARISVRISRMERGNFGDCKPCRSGVWELRIDVGSGYRVYYARVGQTVVLLLCGGDKRSQDADIARACEYWEDWQRSNLQE